MAYKLFKPKAYVKSFKDIDLLALKDKGIKVIILDIDNTLVESRKDVLGESAKRFVKQIKSCRMIPVVISNNVESRVKSFGEELNCDYISFALKPFSTSFKHIMEKYDVTNDEVAVIGDQLLTDVLGGNKQDMYTILVDPFSEKDNIFGMINRQIEKGVFKFLEHKKLIKKGKYYDNL